MAISDNYSPDSTVGNGSTTVFTGNWSPLVAANMRVYLQTISTGALGSPLNQGGGADEYTLTFSSSGYSITMGTAPSSLYNVVRARSVALTQANPFTTAQGFQGLVLENSLDKLTAMVQELRDDLDRSPKFLLTSALSEVIIEDLVADSVLIVDSAGTGIENGPTANQISGAQTSATNASNSAIAAAASASAASDSADEAAASAASVGFTLATNNDFTGNNTFAGKTAFKDDGELTIATGAVTITGTSHTVDTESDAASDDLDTINGGSDGEIIILRTANSSRDVVLKHGTGNITTPDGADITLSDTAQLAFLQYDAELTSWLVVNFTPALIDDDTFATASATSVPSSESTKAYVDNSIGVSETAWTPEITFVTPGNLSVAYSTQIGRYIQLGKLIFAWGHIITSTFTHTTASGALSITGLPVANNSNIPSRGVLSFQGITKAGYTSFCVTAGAGNSTMSVSASGSGQSVTTVGTGDMPTGGTVNFGFSIMYYID